MSLYTAPATSATIVDGSIVDADVNASAAIAGTKISPNFGAQNVTTTGTGTAASFIPTSATVPTNGAYLAAANTYGIATGGVERLRVTSTGQVRLAGAGITFNGDTATANELDDYEEGTFLPTIIGTTVAGTGTYSVNAGSYTKVGNRVLFNLRVIWTAHTGTGNMQVSGLPFTVAGSVSLTIRHTDLTSPVGTVVQAQAPYAGQVVTLESVATGGGAASPLAIDTASDIMISGVYSV